MTAIRSCSFALSHEKPALASPAVRACALAVEVAMPPLIKAPPGLSTSYRLPSLLEDIRLLDLLELSGSTQAASLSLQLSQPSVSRRYRALAHDFALTPCRRAPWGIRYGNSEPIRLLRLACRAHRLTAGVARLGADVILQPLLQGQGCWLPSPPRFRSVSCWLELVRQGVLDGALLSGLELQAQTDWHAADLELVRVGAVNLGLALPAQRAMANAGAATAVLVPHQAIAPGLHGALQILGLRLHTAGHRCQSADQWLRRLERAGLAMPLPELAAADWWLTLRRLPLASALTLPLWLAMPLDWQRQPVMVSVVELLRLRYTDKLQGGPGEVRLA